MNKELFEQLLHRPESSTLDFKRDLYDFPRVPEDEKYRKLAKFIKDIVAFTNTIRSETAYIICGVEEKHGKKILHGITSHIDDAALQEKIKDKVDPKPRFTYYPFEYEGKQFGVIEIPVHKYFVSCKLVPHRKLNKMEGLELNTVYIRRGSSNQVATDQEIALIYAWLKSLEIQPIQLQPIAQKNGIQKSSEEVLQKDTPFNSKKVVRKETDINNNNFSRISLIALFRGIIGGILGLIYGGIILGYIVAKIFIFFAEFNFEVQDSFYIYSSIFIAGFFGTIGGTFFSIVFGTTEPAERRMTLGTSLGIIAGVVLSFYFQEQTIIRLVGGFLSSSIIVIFGGIGGTILSFTIKFFLNSLNLSYRKKDDTANTRRGSSLSTLKITLIIVIVSALLYGKWDGIKAVFTGEKPLRYIIAKSTSSIDEAVQKSKDLINQGYEAEVYSTAQGYYAVTLGYYEETKAQYVKEQAIKRGIIGNDAWLVGQRGILKKIYPVQEGESGIQIVPTISAQNNQQEQTTSTINSDQIRLESNPKTGKDSSDSSIVVQYFPKKNELETIKNALEKLEFTIKKGKAVNQNPTNIMWVGESIGIEDIKKVTLVLLESGIKLQMIKNFPISRTSNQYLIQIGSEPSYSNLPFISIDEVESL